METSPNPEKNYEAWKKDNKIYAEQIEVFCRSHGIDIDSMEHTARKAYEAGWMAATNLALEQHKGKCEIVRKEERYRLEILIQESLGRINEANQNDSVTIAMRIYLNSWLENLNTKNGDRHEK